MTATVRPATMSDLMSSEVSSRITPTMGNTSSRDLGMFAATMPLMELGSSILSTGRGGAGASPLERSSPMATTIGGCRGGTRRERRARGGERRASGSEAEAREDVRGPWASSVDDARGRARGLHARCVVTATTETHIGRRHHHDTAMTNNRRHEIISRLVSIRFVIMTNRTRVRYPVSREKKFSSRSIQESKNRVDRAPACVGEIGEADSASLMANAAADENDLGPRLARSPPRHLSLETCAPVSRSRASHSVAYGRRRRFPTLLQLALGEPRELPQVLLPSNLAIFANTSRSDRPGSSATRPAPTTVTPNPLSSDISSSVFGGMGLVVHIPSSARRVERISHTNLSASSRDSNATA